MPRKSGALRKKDGQVEERPGSRLFTALPSPEDTQPAQREPDPHWPRVIRAKERDRAYASYFRLWPG